MVKQHLEKLQAKIGITFVNQTLLTNVFVHRSYLNEHKAFEQGSNEKLEFLGDSVLSLATSIYLYKQFPELKEGDYTDIKASIVRTESLAQGAEDIELGENLLLSKGEEKGSGRHNINILADCFEALIAAIFIEHGFETAYNFILAHLFKDKLRHIVENKLYLSPKSRLQEIVQASDKVLPTYKLKKEEGPEHNKLFHIEAYVNETFVGVGSGNSKKHAEEAAAKNALEKMQKDGIIT